LSNQDGGNGHYHGKEPDQSSPFAVLLGIYPVTSADGVGTARMPIREHHLQDSGNVQGGLIVTLADYSYYLAVKSRLSPGQSTVTVELKINFTAGAREGELTATARIVSGGRRIIVVEGEVSDGNGVLVARGLSTYLVSEARP